MKAHKYKAFIFDMNGTMINDMAYHEKAWGKILNDEMGANLDAAALKAQMYGKNEEMIERVFGNKFSDEEVKHFVAKKELAYQHAFLPHLKLLPGLESFMLKAKQAGIKIAIGTAAPKTNVDFVMERLKLHEMVDAIVNGDDVSNSKPDPEVFLLCAEKLGIDPAACLVFEDAPKGVEAAQNAGMQAVAVLSYNRREEFESFNNLAALIYDFNGPAINVLIEGMQV